MKRRDNRHDWRYLMAENAAVHREEIEGDLARAIHAREHARVSFDEAEARVRTFTYILTLVDELRGRPPEPEGLMTLHDAMAEVLTADPLGMMRAVHLAAAINERGLYRMGDGRPVEGQQVTARVGRYPHLFEKEGTFIKLKPKLT